MVNSSEPHFSITSAPAPIKTGGGQADVQLSVELTDDDAPGEVDEEETRESRCSTPRPSTRFTGQAAEQSHQQEQSRKNQIEIAERSVQSLSNRANAPHTDQFNDSLYHSKALRKHSLSISSLVGGDTATSPATWPARLTLEQDPYLGQRSSQALTDQTKMNYEMSGQHSLCVPHDGMQRSYSSSSVPHDYELQSRNEAVQNVAYRNSSSSIDQASLAALSDASKAASFEQDSSFGDARYYSYQDDLLDEQSRSSSAFSLHPSLSGGEDENDSHSLARNLQQHDNAADPVPTDVAQPFTLGRTRSDTIRRFNSWVSSSSAPPGLGEVAVQHQHLQQQAYASSHQNLRPLSVSPFSADSDIGGGTTVAIRGPTANDRQRMSSVASEASSSMSSINDPSNSSGTPLRKKRNKCSPEQSRQLEAFFAKNRNPTGKIREELAKRIQMPERSVQVWFQNKRAKTKMMEIKEGIPPELRTTVSKPKPVQRTSSASANESSSVGGRNSQSGASNSSTSKRKKTITQASHAATEEPVIQLPVASLCIGQWRRIKPLICLFSRRNQAFTWYLSSESVGFKLNCPRAYVKRIVFSGPRNPTMHEFSEGVTTQLGFLLVELDRPPQFFMEVFRSSGSKDIDSEPQKASWRQCSDFTEGKQATTVFTHVISGAYTEMREMVLQLCENGGPIGEIVEFQDSLDLASQSTTSPHNMLLQGQQQHLTNDRQSFAMAQAHLDMQNQQSGAAEDAGETAGYYTHLASWPNAASSSWNQFVQQPKESARFSLSTVPSPQSASALDMNALRISTGSVKPMDGSSAVSHTFGAVATDAHTSHGTAAFNVGHAAGLQLNTMQWPHTATPGTTHWHSTGAGSEADVDDNRFAFATPSHTNIASAPAYNTHSFQSQQQQQQQQQDVARMVGVGDMGAHHRVQAYDARSLLFPSSDDIASAAAAAMSANQEQTQIAPVHVLHANMFAQQPSHEASGAGGSGADASGADDHNNKT